MLKPTLIGSAARADTLARWTIANKNCERDAQNGASCGGRHQLISSCAMTQRPPGASRASDRTRARIARFTLERAHSPTTATPDNTRRKYG